MNRRSFLACLGGLPLVGLVKTSPIRTGASYTLVDYGTCKNVLSAAPLTDASFRAARERMKQRGAL